MLTLDEYYALCKEDEEARQEKPCCANCGNYYDEYGYQFCYVFGNPIMEDVNNEKCSSWR